MSASFQVSSLLGNGQWLDGGAMFGNVPRALWERWENPDARGRIPLACRAMLIQWNGINILCETGIGNYMAPDLAERFGVSDLQSNRLLDSLAELGMAEEDIHWVILSHLHFDHAGGLMPSHGSNSNYLRFPRARYVVSKVAWERALKPHARDRASFIPGLTDMLQASQRLLITDTSSVPGLDPQHFHFHHSHGHTPGQLHLLCTGTREKLFFCGDLIPGASWIHIPVTMGYDRNAELVIDEKTSLYPTAHSERWWLFFTHDSRLAAGQLACDAKGKYGVQHGVAAWTQRAF